MVIDGSIAPSIISAVSGLAGVTLGSVLTWKREANNERKQNEKDLTYLALIVGAHLNRFADACWDVADDDGTSRGYPASKDRIYHEATTTSPSFDPLTLDVNWKSVPPSLMDGIFSLPGQIERLLKVIANAYDNDEPPDFAQTFWARQHGFAVLGLEASELSRQLRYRAGLSVDQLSKSILNRDTSLQERRDQLLSAAAAAEVRNAAPFA